MRGTDAVVVGGGVVGCAVAFALAREGWSVTVVERDRVGAHASSAAAGMLAPIAESQGEGALFAAGVESLALFPALVEELRELSGIDPELARSGVLRAAAEHEAPALRARAEALERFECAWLEGEEARKREPLLAPEVAGALWSPREAHVEPLQLTRAYAAAAARRGARFETGAAARGLLRQGDRVTGVRLADDELPAAEVVLCSGAWTRVWEEATGAPLPIDPVRGQLVSLEAPRPSIGSIVWGEAAYVVPRRAGTLLVGATVERVGFDVRTTAEGVGGLLAAGRALLPALASATFLGARAGLRPATPDGLPLVGPLPGLSGVSVAAGHYRNGVLLSPLTALSIAARLVGGAPEDARFAPSRFAN